VAHLAGDAPRRLGHLRPGHLGAADGEGRRSFHDDVVADADVVAGVDDAGASTLPWGTKSSISTRLTGTLNRPTGGLLDTEREDAVLLSEGGELLTLGIVRPKLGIPTFRGQDVLGEQGVAGPSPNW